MRLGAMIMASVLASSVAVDPASPFGSVSYALSRKEQPIECEPGTTWHEEQDVARYATAGEDMPGRVGWCEKPDGTRHGLMRIWWANGWLKAESTFGDGVENGPVQTFYADGTPQLATTHRDGKPDGRYMHWHANGQRARLMFYDNGQPHGWAQYWDEKGQLTAQGTFVEGRKEGTWESWYANGVLKDATRYEDGRLHGRQLVFAEGGVFYAGSCWDRGEQRWQTRSEIEARTRACRPY